MAIRRLLLAVTICFLLAGLPLETSAVASTSTSDGAVAESATRISACRDAAIKKGNAKVDILFLIDTSQSLRKSDPIGKTIRDPARVQAIESVVEMLQPKADNSEPLNIRVNFLDFGSSVRSSFSPGGWQSIQEFNFPSIKDFGSKDDDPDTDYVGALVDAGGVVDVLKQAASESDCQIVLWFTDGKFDIDSKTVNGSREFNWLKSEIGDGIVKDSSSAKKAREVGERLLCEKGDSREFAVADELRSLDNNDSLTVIGVGLNKSAAVNNFDILKRLLEDPNCGEKTPVGFMVEVKSADDLAAAMRRSLFKIVEPPVVCDEQVAGGAGIYLAEPVVRADIFLRSREKVSEIQLVKLGKDNETLSNVLLYKNGEVFPGDLLPGVKVTTRKVNDDPTLETTLEFSLPTQEWVGNWALRACNETNSGPAQIDADVIVRGCVAFDLAAGDDKIVVGRSKKIFLLLTRCGTDASRLSTVQELSLVATVRIGDELIQATLRDGESAIEIPFAPTDSDLNGATTKQVMLQVLEVDATYGVLEGSQPVVLSWPTENSVFPVTISRTPSTPYVDKPTCGMLSKETKSVTCEFTARASDAIGQVVTEGPTLTPSKSLGPVKISSQMSKQFPLTVQPGQPETFSLTFTIDGTRTNLEKVNQPFTINFEYQTDGEPSESAIVEGSFVVEPDFGVQPNWRRSLLFAILGLLVALAIFASARLIFARIQVPREGMLWAGAIDVDRCDPDTIRTAVSSARVDMVALPLRMTRFGLGSVSELRMVGDCNLDLRARAGLRMLSELGYVVATHHEFFVIGSGGFVKKGRAGRTSLNLVGEWWLIPQGIVDGNAETSEVVRSRLEGVPGKLVFVAVSAELPVSFFSDLGSRISATVPSGLSEIADLCWLKTNADEGQDGPTRPTEPGSSLPDI